MKTLFPEIIEHLRREAPEGHLEFRHDLDNLPFSGKFKGHLVRLTADAVHDMRSKSDACYSNTMWAGPSEDGSGMWVATTIDPPSADAKVLEWYPFSEFLAFVREGEPTEGLQKYEYTVEDVPLDFGDSNEGVARVLNERAKKGLRVVQLFPGMSDAPHVMRSLFERKVK